MPGGTRARGRVCTAPFDPRSPNPNATIPGLPCFYPRESSHSAMALGVRAPEVVGPWSCTPCFVTVKCLSGPGDSSNFCTRELGEWPFAVFQTIGAPGPASTLGHPWPPLARSLRDRTGITASPLDLRRVKLSEIKFLALSSPGDPPVDPSKGEAYFTAIRLSSGGGGGRGTS